ncbi:hypothetical protein HYW67_04120 [Candidatus Parcubacteria bacterium]|nr:hypothetical protein [Candidatus Parcubacteria bacterium]
MAVTRMLPKVHYNEPLTPLTKHHPAALGWTHPHLGNPAMQQIGTNSSDKQKTLVL